MRTVARMIAATARAQRPFSQHAPSKGDNAINMITGQQANVRNTPFMGMDWSRINTSPGLPHHLRLHLVPHGGYQTYEIPMRDVVRW